MLDSSPVQAAGPCIAAQAREGRDAPLLGRTALTLDSSRDIVTAQWSRHLRADLQATPSEIIQHRMRSCRVSRNSIALSHIGATHPATKLEGRPECHS